MSGSTPAKDVYGPYSGTYDGTASSNPLGPMPSTSAAHFVEDSNHSNRGYVDLSAYNSALEPTEALTTAAWVNVDPSSETGAIDSIMTLGPNVGNVSSNGIAIRSFDGQLYPLGNETYNYYSVSIGCTSSWDYVGGSPGAISISPSTWHLIVEVEPPATAGSNTVTVSLYVDGVLSAAEQVQTGINRCNSGSNSLAYDGNAYIGSPENNGSDGFQGSVADATEFNRALNSAEIQKLCDNVCQRPPVLGLSGYRTGPSSRGGGSTLAGCTCGVGRKSAQPGTKEPINEATGDFYDSATDLTVPGPGLPLQFTRTYDTAAARQPVSGPLGNGWADNLDMSVSLNGTVATVTEENGAQDTFTEYTTGDTETRGWCAASDTVSDYCPDSPNILASLHQNADGSFMLTRGVKQDEIFTFSASSPHMLTEVQDNPTLSAADYLASASEAAGTGECPLGSTISCTVWTSYTPGNRSGGTLTLVSNSSSTQPLTEVIGLAAEANAAPTEATFCYNGQSCASTSSPSGELFSATDPGALATYYTYDTSSDLVTKTGPTTQAYSPSLSHLTNNTFDSSGRVTEQTDPDGQATTFCYAGDNTSASGGTTTVDVYPDGATGSACNPSGTYEQTVDQFYSGELAWSTSGAASAATEITNRDAAVGATIQAIDPDGNQSTEGLQYVSQSNPSGLSTTDPFGIADAVTTSDALGNQTQAAYVPQTTPAPTEQNLIWCQVDAADFANGARCPSTQLTTVPGAGSGVATQQCSTSSTGACLGATVTYYNAAGQPVAVTDPRGYTSITAYTPSGGSVPSGLAYCTVAGAQYTTTEYNSSGVTCPSYPPSATVGATTTTFDASGNVVSVSTATAAGTSTTTTAYGAQSSPPSGCPTNTGSNAYPNLPAVVTDPSGTVTCFVYNAAGQVIEQVSAFGVETEITINAYDVFGRLYCTISPLSYSEGHTTCPATAPTSAPNHGGTPQWPGDTITIYDSNNRPIYVVNPLGGVIQTAYDQAGEVYCTETALDYAQTSPTISCPTTPPTSPPTGTVTGYTTNLYDDEGRPVSTTDPIGDTTTTTYDAAGNVIATTTTPATTTNDPATTTYAQFNADNQQIATCADPDGTGGGWAGHCGQQNMVAISCPTTSWCMGVDSGGNAFVDSSGTWGAATNVDPATPLSGVSCTGTSACTAIDISGNAFTYNGISWSSPTVIDSGQDLSGISCPTTSFCAAVDTDGYVILDSSGTWSSPSYMDPGASLTDVSCASASMCVAVDASGGALAYNGTTWTPATPAPDPGVQLNAVSCPSTTSCVAVDAAGYAFTYNGTSWSALTDIDGTHALVAVSCSSSTFCEALDNGGNALAFNGSAWASSAVDSPNAMSALSCDSTSACVASDAVGYALAYNGTSWSAPVYVDQAASVLDSTSLSAYDPNGNAYCTTSADAFALGPYDAAASSGGYECPPWNPAWISSPPSLSNPPLYSYTPDVPPNVNQANGVSLSFSDADGSVMEQVNPGLTSAEDLASSTPDVSATVTAYDGDGQPYCSADPTNASAWFAVNPSGSYPWMCPNIPPSVAPTGTATGYTTTTYDAAGRPLTSTDQVGDTTATTYDAFGDKVATTSGYNALPPANPDEGQTTSYCYEWQFVAGQCATLWQPPAAVDASHVLNGVSCASEVFCEAVDASGRAVPYSGTSWGTAATIDSARSVNAVSCPSSTFCQAVGASGYAVKYTGTWASPGDIDGARNLEAVSCASSSFCEAAGASGYAVKFNGTTWAASADVDSTRTITGVSCVSSTFCMAVDAGGYELKFNGTAWGGATRVDSTRAMSAISCPTTSFCMAVDTSGYALEYTGTWQTAVQIDGTTALHGVLCPSTTLCTAVDAAGKVLRWNGSSWASTNVDGSTSISAVSCPAIYFCSSVDASGNAVANRPGIGLASQVWSVTTPVTATDPSGAVTTTTDLSGGSVGTTETPAGITTDAYDAMGDLSSSSYSGTASGYATPHSVATSYNADGSRSQMIDGTGTTNYSYDDAGDLTEQQFTAGSGTGLSNQSVGYNYDAQGTIGAITYPSYTGQSNSQASYTYNTDGLMSSVSDWQSPKNTVSFSYDQDGNETEQSNDAGTSSTAFTYDLGDRTTDVKVTTGLMATQIPPAAPNGESTSPSSALSQSMAAMGASGTTPPPATIGQPDCATTNWTFDFSMAPNGANPGSRSPDGQITTTGFDQSDNCGNSFDSNFGFGYDQAERLITTTRSIGTQGSANDVAPDAAGNDRLIYTFKGSSTQTFDAASELLSQTTGSTTTNDAYDTLGDLTSSTVGSSVTAYGYDQLGRMTTYTAPSGVSTAYTDNGDGLEASDQPSGGTLAQLLWDDASPTPSPLSDGSDYFIYGPGQTPVEQFNITASPPSSNPTFLNTSTEDGTDAYVITNSSGQYTNFSVYDPFGTMNVSNEGSVFGYAGQYSDVASLNPSGLVNMRARWYEPSTGEFTTVDPLVSQTGQPYGYAGDDPVNASDPSGLCPGLGDQPDSNYWVPCTPAQVAAWHAAAGAAKAAGAAPYCSNFISCTLYNPGAILPSAGSAVVGLATLPETKAESFVGCLHNDSALNCFNYNYNPVYATLVSGRDAYYGWSDPCVSGWAEAGSIGQTALGFAASVGVAYGGAEAFSGALGLGAGTGSAAADAADTETGTVVLGHYPEYLELGQETGAETFDIPESVWDSMTPEEQWAANQAFLDRAIANGSEFRLATPADAAREGSFYELELQYLESKGYTVSSDGQSLVPPGRG